MREKIEIVGNVVLQSDADREVYVKNNKKRVTAIGAVVVVLAGASVTYYLVSRHHVGDETAGVGSVNPEAAAGRRTEPIPKLADPFEVPPSEGTGSYTPPAQQSGSGKAKSR
jgi:hypothetical protein